MKRYDGLYIGTLNGKTINAFKSDNGWIAKAMGSHGSMIVVKAKTMKQAVSHLVGEFWF